MKNFALKAKISNAILAATPDTAMLPFDFPYGKFPHDFTYEIFICEIVMWN